MRDNYHDPSAISNLATAALAYAQRGWHVLPCDPQTKRPLIKRGLHAATLDPEQIEAWWQQWPCALIGIRTGPESGLWVLDVDIHPNEGIDGSVSITALERQHGALPNTLTSATPRGGFHLFFKWHPGIRNNADGKLGAHLDVRGEGGYVIVPPSMRWDRKCYGWRENCPAEPAEAPTWLIELLTAPAAAPALINDNASYNSSGNGYAHAALAREIDAVASAQIGQRNHILNRASFNLHQLAASGALTESEVQDRLFNAATACGLIRDDGADSVRATIASGGSAGLRKPRSIPERAPSPSTIKPETLAALMAASADAPKPKTEWHFHHDDNPAPTPWLIKNILPETGAGLISGQWGTYKTTVALDLAVSVMTGASFASRYAVKRPGGVAYFALEGISGLASRLTAIARTHDSTGALPFAYRGDCPALTAADALDKLTIMIGAATRQIQDRFDVTTVLVFIDTVVTAAGYTKSGDDNDAAIAQRVMSVLSGLSQRTGALAIGIDHFGKVTDTGTRGSSAKEGHADVVLALLADRELTGTISNTRLAVRKLRDGFSGLELPFAPRTLQIGTDADGDPITRVIIDWTTATEERPSNKAWPKSLRLLHRILMNILVDGVDIQPFLNGPTVRACNLNLVRAEFNRQYPADGDSKQKASIRRKAFKRAIADAQAKELVVVREINDTQMVWLAKAEAGS